MKVNIIKSPGLDSQSKLLWSYLSVSLLVLMLYFLDVRWTNLTLPMCLAVLLLALSLSTCKSFVRKCGNMLNGYVLILASFIFAYPLSAVVHLIGTGKRRGFYDLVRSSLHPNYEGIFYSLFLISIALIALLIGLKKSDFLETKSLHLKLNPSIMIPLGIIFTLFGLIGTTKLFGSATSISEILLTVDRAKEIGGGSARYYFMSTWLSWGLIFLTACWLNRPLACSNYRLASVVTIITVVILGNIFWSGGRASGIIALLPGLLLFQRVHPNYPRIVIIFFGTTIIAYILVVTLIRSGTEEMVGMVDSQIALLDWHAGRFSMIGLSLDMVKEQGHAWGGTLFEGLANAINAPFVLLKVDPFVPVPRGITSYVGGYLVNDPNKHGIVPGTICEFYYNFGLLGVALGYFLIGKLGQICIRTMHTTTSAGLFCICAYTLVLTCTGIIPGTATAWIYYLITLGFPVIALYGWELILSQSLKYRSHFQIRRQSSPRIFHPPQVK